MGRVLHVRIHGLDPGDRDALHDRFRELAGARLWRDGAPWLADAQSGDLFSMEFFRHATTVAAIESGDAGPLSAATFVRLKGDETDALALLFILRDLSERFSVRVVLHDAENPIAKLRHIDLQGGRLPDGGALEAILVRRSIFKKLPNGFRIEMFPPGALDTVFGAADDEEGERRTWWFLVHGMRGSGSSFFEAEAEAMRIYNGLRHLE